MHSTRSRPVSSAQRNVHPRLDEVLACRQGRPWRAPPHTPSVDAFARLQALLGSPPDKLILDSGCGTGESTRAIARAWPDCMVIGVDKSAARLARTGGSHFPYREGNAVWLRADLPTFWRLALEAGWRLRRHYLLYPNPWPKAGQLRRRWHAHPSFPDLLRLGGVLEMRCNWWVYAQEFAQALTILTGQAVQPEALGPEGMVSSAFEHKYRRSGHALYSVSLSLDSGAV